MWISVRCNPLKYIDPIISCQVDVNFSSSRYSGYCVLSLAGFRAQALFTVRAAIHIHVELVIAKCNLDVSLVSSDCSKC